jgi:tetratricopeptide (TPR) repeat protein
MAATQQRALTAAVRLGDTFRQARAHRLLGFAASRQTRYADARHHLEQALTMNRELGDHVAQGHTAMTLAQVVARSGTHQEALGHARTAHAAFEAGDQRYGQANALNAIGWYHAQLGEYAEALAHCTRALAVTEELGDTRGAAGTWDSMGYAHHRLGDHDRAAECYREAIGRYAAADDRYFEADSLLHLADAERAAGRTTHALTAARRALDLLTALDHPDAERAREKLTELGRPPT